MKAVVYLRDGSPGRLLLRDVDKPAPRAGEVLVRVRAVSLNAEDYRSIRLGIIPKRGIFGADIAGIVEASGADARGFLPGDEVVGDLSAHGFGGLAEYVAAPAIALAKKPAGVSFEEAAAVPTAALTALQALRDKGGLQPGQRVLVCGAGGGVGMVAVQLAKTFGAEVTAVCGTANAARMPALGADHVVDYTKEDFTAVGARYDLILAVNGKYPLGAYRRLLTRKGVCVVLGGALSQVFAAMFLGPLLSLGGRKVRLLAAKPNAADLEYLLSLAANGAIKPYIERRQPLSEAPEAMRYVSQGHAMGKVVITV